MLDKFSGEETPDDPITEEILATPSLRGVPIEIESRNTLNINPNVIPKQRENFMYLLKNNMEGFLWDYNDMKGIHPYFFTYHIYLKQGSQSVEKLQCRMNPTLKNVVKEELLKLLDCNIIYPIYNS